MLVLCEPYLCPALRHHGCSRCQAGLRASRKAPPQALAPFVSSAVSAGRPQGEAWPLSFDGTGLTAAALKGIAEELPEQIALLKQLPKDIAGNAAWPTGTAELLSTEEAGRSMGKFLHKCPKLEKACRHVAARIPIILLASAV